MKEVIKYAMAFFNLHPQQTDQRFLIKKFCKVFLQKIRFQIKASSRIPNLGCRIQQENRGRAYSDLITNTYNKLSKFSTFFATLISKPQNKQTPEAANRN